MLDMVHKCVLQIILTLNLHIYQAVLSKLMYKYEDHRARSASAARAIIHEGLAQGPKSDMSTMMI